MTNIEVFALEGIGEVAAGDDLISVIAQAYANYQPQDGDVSTHHDGLAQREAIRRYSEVCIVMVRLVIVEEHFE